ncbi:D-alanyl-D-alanine carboxypeptidase/D-alanyl-D-alanine-endopeptidase [Kitasatospora sp. MAP5-34]|uniref:D-alanyl-D-alanine carboxypeptidase/D-alanyl-D-alanine endopeptidase n=1 Tax=Kitasatospora sp. MAP5-34 TaxID=3035102 RepID=UPI0024750530|nr:D-alanyl-D-alanine carboxypeptidase/D-alanyl-D-alanine-endopeptidase [Kitasatospora sp. MAP5-34]MDH6574505.1 D-alanyl-D-alanine carboxypeptidase/D-alanyl-D-alanine-endopeptidase (penicillin-binding protein 4) [Kitasatospora sp. MAP5-34]
MPLSARLRRRTLPFAAVALAATLLAGSAQADSPSPADPKLTGDLDTILADARLAGAQAGVEVIDTTTGQVVYQHQADALLTPASTLKNVTSAAALDLLGPDHVFTTEVRTTGDVNGGVLNGDIVLRGGGDPTLLTQDLDNLAAKVADSGITTVTGRVLADGSRFDNVPLGPGWAWDDEPVSYSPQISGLTVSTDAEYTMDNVQVTVTPGAQGEAAQITLNPAETPVQLTGQVTTGAAGSQLTSYATRLHGVNQIALSGSIPVGAAPATYWTTVADPTSFTGAVFAGALARHGVTVGNPVQTATGTETSQLLASHDSQPLSTLILPMLKVSNNGMAESLIKEIGKVKGGQGSWAAGVAQVKSFLAANGLASPAGRQVDGSGLSRYDLITPAKMTALLKLAVNKPWFQSWYDAMPVAGNPARMVGGTLAARMVGTAAANNVHAKSGSMSGVDNLTGYATTPDGRRLAFTVMTNNFAGTNPRPLLDAIAVRLAAGPAAAPAIAKSLKAPAPLLAPSRARALHNAPVDDSFTTRWDDCETLSHC